MNKGNSAEIRHIRQATVKDVDSMHFIRLSVTENKLSDPARITISDYIRFITERGRGWVCQQDDRIVGFAIADVTGRNIWALFVMPGHEGIGIGTMLHNFMLDWYFNQQHEWVWLSTSPATRAERFYTNAGWNNMGVQENQEIRFEMTKENWEKTKTMVKVY